MRPGDHQHAKMTCTKYELHFFVFENYEFYYILLPHQCQKKEKKEEEERNTKKQKTTRTKTDN